MIEAKGRCRKLLLLATYLRLMLKNQKSTTHIVRCLEVMFQRPHYKLIKSWKTVKVYKRKIEPILEDQDES